MISAMEALDVGCLRIKTMQRVHGTNSEQG